MTGSDLLHYLHRELVVVGSDVGRAVYGREFMLSGSDFVVFGFSEHTQFPKLFVEICHILFHSWLDDPEIVVVEFLTLGSFCAEKSATRINKVSSLIVHFFVYKKVFLFGSHRGAHAFDVRVAEKLKNSHRLSVQRFHRTQKRSLFIQRFAAVRTERGRDAKGLSLDERVGGRIPRGISSRLESRSQSSRREAGSVGLPFYQFFSRKLHYHSAVGCGSNEAVMLFSRDTGKRLEPVRVVRRAVSYRPVLHGIRDRVGYRDVELRPSVDSSFQRPVHVRRQRCSHHPVVKDHAAEIVRYRLHNFILLFQ